MNIEFKTVKISNPDIFKTIEYNSNLKYYNIETEYLVERNSNNQDKSLNNKTNLLNLIIKKEENSIKNQKRELESIGITLKKNNFKSINDYFLKEAELECYSLFLNECFIDSIIISKSKSYKSIYFAYIHNNLLYTFDFKSYIVYNINYNHSSEVFKLNKKYKLISQNKKNKNEIDKHNCTVIYNIKSNKIEFIYNEVNSLKDEFIIYNIKDKENLFVSSIKSLSNIDDFMKKEIKDFSFNIKTCEKTYYFDDNKEYFIVLLNDLFSLYLLDNREKNKKNQHTKVFQLQSKCDISFLEKKYSLDYNNKDNQFEIYSHRGYKYNLLLSKNRLIRPVIMNISPSSSSIELYDYLNINNKRFIYIIEEIKIILYYNLHIKQQTYSESINKIYIYLHDNNLFSIIVSLLSNLSSINFDYLISYHLKDYRMILIIIILFISNNKLSFNRLQEWFSTRKLKKVFDEYAFIVLYWFVCEIELEKLNSNIFQCLVEFIK